MNTHSKIGLIGTGNMAHFLGKKLQFSAFPIAAVWGRDRVYTQNFATVIDATAFKALEAFANAVDIIFIAVKDDAIATIAEDLKQFRDKTIIHFSGTKPLAILQEYFKNSGVFWPIYSINRLQMPAHRNIPIIISAEKYEVQQCLSNIASEITNHFEIVSEEKRKKLHLMAVMTNNFMNHLAAITQEFGKENDTLFEWIIPIIQQTAERMHAPNIAALQTGPAIRNDQSTLQDHLQLLQAHPEWQHLYQTISDSIIDYHKQKK